MISLEALPKIIDTSQLTTDLDGTLHYDHSQWIDMRLVSNCIIPFFIYENPSRHGRILKQI